MTNLWCQSLEAIPTKVPPPDFTRKAVKKRKGKKKREKDRKKQTYLNNHKQNTPKNLSLLLFSISFLGLREFFDQSQRTIHAPNDLYFPCFWVTFFFFLSFFLFLFLQLSNPPALPLSQTRKERKRKKKKRRWLLP
jgi:hypothetical protein